MSDLSRTELRDLAKAATAIVRDEASLGYEQRSPDTFSGEYVTGAQVRAVVEALEDAQYVVIPRRDLRLVYGSGLYDGNGRAIEELKASIYQHVAERAQELAAPPHLLPPDDASKRDETPAPEIAPSVAVAPAQPKPSKESDTFVAVGMLLRRLSRDGMMPSMAEYNEQRGDLPMAQTLIYKLGVAKWSDLARKLNLTPVPPGGGQGAGRGRQSTEAKRPAAPVPSATRQVAPRIAELRATRAAAAASEPVTDGKPIIHRAPDGGVTTILRSADGRQNAMLRAFEDKGNG